MSLPPSLPLAPVKVPRPVTVQPNIDSVPFGLRANDVKLHVVNIDSRFRQTSTPSPTKIDAEIVKVEQTSASDFYFYLSPPIKNVLQIKVTSIEFPNNYPFFTEKRGNTTLRILYEDGGIGKSAVITIPDGNYTAGDMVDTLNELFSAAGSELTWLSVTFSEITGAFTFTGTKRFGIDAPYESFRRPFDYGLAYYLGFTRELHKSYASGSNWIIMSNKCAHFAGDPYLLLQVNDYTCVRQTTSETTIPALAKIVLREPKNYMTFDDYGSQHSKEVVFANPENIARLHVRVLDPYGVPIDMCSANFSFSLEVLEVKNSSLYSTLLGSISTHYF
jgi:hypothetical protein